MKNIVNLALVSAVLAGASLCCLWNCSKSTEQDWSSQIDDIYSRLWKIENPHINSVQEQLDTMRAVFPKLDAADEAFKAYSDSLSKSLSTFSAELSEIERKTSTLSEAFDKAISDAAASGDVDSDIKVKKLTVVRDDALAQIDGARALTDKVFMELQRAVEKAARLDVAFRTDVANAKEYITTVSPDDWAQVSVSTLDHSDKIASDLAVISALAKGLNSSFSALQAILSGNLKSEVAAAMIPVLSYFSEDLATEIINSYARTAYAAASSLEKVYSSKLAAAVAIASENLRNCVNPALGEYGALVEADSLLSYSERWQKSQLNSQITYLENIANSSVIDVNIDAAVADNQDAQEELKSSSAKLHSNLDSGAQLLQEEYRKAIREAISTNNGSLKGKIAIGVVETNITARELLKGAETQNNNLEQRVSGTWNEVTIVRKALIQNDTDELSRRIAELARRIQSITFIPEYSDGKVTAYYRTDEEGTLYPLSSHIRFDIRPSSAAAELASVWQNALALKGIYTLTRASAGEEFDVAIANVIESNGRLDITFRSSSIEECFFENEVSASICLLVSQGDSQKSSSYIAMTPKSLDWIEIPDAVFRDYLISTFDSDGDGNISTYEAMSIKDIDVSGIAPDSHIHSLEGISYFTNLETLNCAGHHLTSLDLSSNTRLTSINCKGNELTQVNLTKCEDLETLDLSDNNLSDIDLSQNLSLKVVNLDENVDLKELEVIYNSALENLSVKNTGLTRLDLSGNRSLVSFNVFEPLSQEIDVIVASQDWLSNVSVIANYGATFYEGENSFFFNGGIEIDGVTWKQYDSEASETDLYGGTNKWAVAKAACPSGWKLPSRGNFAEITNNASDWTEYKGLIGRWFSGSQPYSESVPAVFLNATSATSNYGVYWGNDYVGDRTLNALYFNDSSINPNYTGYTFEFSNDRYGSRCVKE